MSFDSETAKTINNAQTNLNTTIQAHVDPCRHMFIPHRLRIAGHPAIDVLPLDIVFAKSKVQNGKVITGAALYTPDLATVVLDTKLIALTYRNRLNSSWAVVIEYDSETKSWKATKSAYGKLLFYSFGNTWEGFFKHVTLPGLQNGEPCAFLDVPQMREQ